MFIYIPWLCALIKVLPAPLYPSETGAEQGLPHYFTTEAEKDQGAWPGSPRMQVFSSQSQPETSAQLHDMCCPGLIASSQMVLTSGPQHTCHPLQLYKDSGHV